MYEMLNHIVAGLSLLALVVSAPPTKTAEEVRIVGGHQIDITEAPYQVSLVNGGRHACGGTIIASDLILTAAHCVIGNNPYQFKVRVGSSSNKDGGELHQVGDLVWHPSFSYSKMDYDVAVLRLEQPLVFDDKVAAIAMSDAEDKIGDGELTTVTGWGSLYEGGIGPSVLQMVEVPTISERACKAAYEPLYSITPTMLCAGLPTGGKDACQGDSGGPLVYHGKLAGVISWGIGCARPRFPGVYARVSALRSWIDNNSAYLRVKQILRGFKLNELQNGTF